MLNIIKIKEINNTPAKEFFEGALIWKRNECYIKKITLGKKKIRIVSGDNKTFKLPNPLSLLDNESADLLRQKAREEARMNGQTPLRLQFGNQQVIFVRAQ